MWFSGGAKTVSEDLQDWIVIAGDECGLEHHMPQQAPSTCNGALSAHSSTVMCDGREASEGCGLFPRDLAELGHFGNQHGADVRHPCILRSLGVKEDISITQSEFANLFVVVGPATNDPVLLKQEMP